MDTILEVRNLKKYFKTPQGDLHAVDDVSFSIMRGKTLGVVGESGCGKSTLGNLIIGLLTPTSGEIFFEGREISKVQGEERRNLFKKIQMIFQDPFSSLNPRMYVEQLIAEPLKNFRVCKNKKELEQRVTELMEFAGIPQRLRYSYPHELDGGRRQRIGIARALALDPTFVVCDEPVSALDVSIQAQILNLMMDAQEEKGLTFMFISHDLSVVKHISSDIVVMYLGQIVERASPKKLFKDPLHPYTKGLLAAIPVPSAERKKRSILRGELTSPINPGKKCRFANRCIYAEERCRCEEPVLREIMPEHYVSCHRAEEINSIPSQAEATESNR
ncbi:MAG: ATP-binding cassette domain-containing protein [Clostridiales bacterium]|nr:ATP-binding cassette domain-containing protein [Clostridiales bacterium]